MAELKKGFQTLLKDLSLACFRIMKFETWCLEDEDTIYPFTGPTDLWCYITFFLNEVWTCWKIRFEKSSGLTVDAQGTSFQLEG